MIAIVNNVAKNSNQLIINNYKVNHMECMMWNGLMKPNPLLMPHFRLNTQVDNVWHALHLVIVEIPSP